MEKHIVVENKTWHSEEAHLAPLEQDIVVRRPDGVLCARSVYNMRGMFKPGDIIKVYKTNDKDAVLNLEVACSYKLGNKYYVDLKQVPIICLHSGVMVHDSGVRDFYKNIKFMDSMRLNRDIARVLWQRGIMPSLSKITNLRLFLGDVHTL